MDFPYLDLPQVIVVFIGVLFLFCEDSCHQVLRPEKSEIKLSALCWMFGMLSISSVFSGQHSRFGNGDHDSHINILVGDVWNAAMPIMNGTFIRSIQSEYPSISWSNS